MHGDAVQTVIDGVGIVRPIRLSFDPDRRPPRLQRLRVPGRLAGGGGERPGGVPRQSDPSRNPGYSAAVDAFLDSSARVNRQVFDEAHAICARPLYDLTAPDRIFAPGEERVARLHATLIAMTNKEDRT